jgi:malonyl-CoA O-methyltransferase
MMRSGFQTVTQRSDDYAAWAPSYPPHAHNALMDVEESAMLSLLPPVAGRDVLDAGCGTGRYLRIVAALGARAWGVDCSPAMIARARLLGAPVALADMRQLPIRSASIDVVVSGLAINDVPDFAPVAAEWARVLRRRGVVVYSGLHPIGQSLGWRRTYPTPDGVRELRAWWHTWAAQRDACRRAGLEIEAASEPPVERDGTPAALVVRARRRR